MPWGSGVGPKELFGVSFYKLDNLIYDNLTLMA